MMKEQPVFRFAEEDDVGKILFFIRELAAYEKLESEVVATEELLREWIFEKNKAEVLFVQCGGEDVGFALFFHNFSTFLGRAGTTRAEPRVVVPRLEPPEHRLLSLPRRSADGRMDGVPRGGQSPALAGRRPPHPLFPSLKISFRFFASPVYSGDIFCTFFKNTLHFFRETTMIKI